MSSIQAMAQTTYYSKGNLAVNTAANWNTQRDGSGTNAASFGTNNTWVIQNGHSMTLSGTATWSSGTGSTVRIEGGGTWTNSSSGTVTIPTFQIYGNGTYIHNTGSATVPGTTKQFANTTNGGNGNGTYEIQNTGTSGFSTGITWGNVRINRSTTTQSVGNSGAFAEVRGNFIMDAFGSNEFRLTAAQTTTHNIDGDLIVNGGILNIKSGAGAVPINLGGNLTITGGTLTTGSGTSTITFTGANKMFTHSGGILTATNMNWALANGASLTMANNFSLASTRTFTLNATSSLALAPNVSLTIAGTANFGGQSVTLKSDATGTASISQISGTLGGASNVTVERFIPTAKRAWRMISSPVSGTTINAAWQEGVSDNSNPHAGYGTHITGPSSVNGFDQSGAASNPSNPVSLKIWNQGTQKWDAATSTNTGDITDQSGYILFIRGHRGLDITTTNTPAPTTTTLRATGTLRQGTLTNYVTTSALATEYTLMGNPYPSTLDLELFNGTGENETITSFYAWDPTLTGNFGVGGYVMIEKDGADWEVTPNGGAMTTNTNARFLPAGAAIFVKSPGIATGITMKESYKATGTSSLTYFRTGGVNMNLAVNLNNSSSVTLDGVRVKFDAAYSNNITAEDAKKLNNEAENISIRRNGMSLIVEKRSPVTQDDTLFVRLSGMKQNTAYELKFVPTDLTGVNAFLVDGYLNTTTPLNVTGISTINFSTDANVASVGDRFMVVFRPSSVLPVTFTGIRAQEKNGDVAVEWNVTNEVNTLSYVVERSRDGRSFANVATVNATTSAEAGKVYNWLDVNAPRGVNYYRIRSVQADNNNKYTPVVKVTLGAVVADVNVYPNPIKNGRMTVQVNDLAAGAYELRVLNAGGQVIMSRKLQHGGGSAVQDIKLPVGAAKGIYRLQVTGTETNIIKAIVVE